MTLLLDNLINLGIVESLPDIKDSRIINISLTDKSRKAVNELRWSMRNNIRKKLACLKDEEFKELSVLLTRLRYLGSKLE